MKIVIPILILFFTWTTDAQVKLIEYASNYTNTTNGGDYLAPVNDIYSSLLHSGVFPRYSEKGFHIRLGVVFMRMNIVEGMKQFRGKTEGFEEELFADVPTIVGNAKGVELESSEGAVYTFPGGIDLNSLNLAIPDLYLGTLFGTDVYGRYLVVPLPQDLTNITVYGGGIRHDFGRYFLPEYVKWYFSYCYHFSSINDQLESINQLAQTQIGVKLNRIGIYGLFGYELNDMKLTIDDGMNSGGEEQVLNLYENSPIRFGGGLNLTFKYFDLFGEYNMNNPTNIVFGFAVGI